MVCSAVCNVFDCVVCSAVCSVFDCMQCDDFKED